MQRIALPNDVIDHLPVPRSERLVVRLVEGEVRLREGDAAAALGRTEAAIGALRELRADRLGHRRARRLLSQIGARA